MDRDDENLLPELKPANEAVLADVENYDLWAKLLTTAETQEGGLTRNSSPQAIAATRAIYDRFLARFPLMYAYWKKYADLEFAIAGTEAAELVYERGVAAITHSTDLWTHYCQFKMETCHDRDTIRELFERGVNVVGLDFMGHTFWDKYLEYEERVSRQDLVFEIYKRLIHIPLHQYSKYFSRFQTMSADRSPNDLAPDDVVAQHRAEINMEASQGGKSEEEVNTELQARIGAYLSEIHNKTTQEVNKRWGFEREIKRAYFHVTELESSELSTWHKYLDFEETEGDPNRIVALYERCLIATASHEEFWLRYVRWQTGQIGKTQDVRHIYMRASCIFVPIAQPTVRLHWALFEEKEGRTALAQEIYEAMLLQMPDLVTAIVNLANLRRRTDGVDAASTVYQEYISSNATSSEVKAQLISECANLLWKVKHAPEDARQLFQRHQQAFQGSKIFWEKFLHFELEQSTDTEEEASRTAKIKAVFDEIRVKSLLSAEPLKELGQVYMDYLLERGTKNVAEEYLTMDREINRR